MTVAALACIAVAAFVAGWIAANFKGWTGDRLVLTPHASPEFYAEVRRAEREAR